MKTLLLDGVHKSFGGLKATNNVSFKVNPGEIVGLIGPNGAGKTTLFNCITGFLKVDSGKIEFGEEDIHNHSPDKINEKGIARTFQIPQTFRNMTVLENVMVGAFCRTNSIHIAIKRAEEVLEFTHLIDKRDLLGGHITLADEKMLSIARALATDPNLLLLDESMSGLTPVEAQNAIKMVEKISESGVSIIVVEHVMEIVMPISNRVVVLDAGNKIADGDPNTVSKDPEVIKSYLGGEF